MDRAVSKRWYDNAGMFTLTPRYCLRSITVSNLIILQWSEDWAWRTFASQQAVGLARRIACWDYNGKFDLEEPYGNMINI